MDSFYDQMKYLSQRDKVLSANIANSDTPNYKPKELRRKGGGDSSMSITNSMHMNADEDISFDLVDAEVLEIKPNGNAVNLENQLLKKSENSIRLNEATNLYNKSRSMLRTAITGNR